MGIPAPNEKSLDPKDHPYTVIDLGVWRVYLHKESFALGLPLSFLRWQTITKLLPVLQRFLAEIYHLNPGLVVLVFVLRLWTALDQSIKIYISSKLLKTIEISLLQGRPDIHGIVMTAALQVIFHVFHAIFHWLRQRVEPILQTQVELYFEEHLLRASLRLDLPTSQAKTVHASPTGAWISFEHLVGMFETFSQISSQLFFIYRQTNGGFAFTFLSLAGPILVGTNNRFLWMKPFVVCSKNTSFLRMHALRRLALSDREDIISSDIGNWICAEFKKARNKLGPISDVFPATQYFTPPNPVSRIMECLRADLPTFYFAANAILNPKEISLTSFAILQQHSQALDSTFRMLSMEFSRASKCYSDIEELYTLADTENIMVDGDQAYPNQTLSSEKGMSFELRNVSFTYPGGKSAENALKNVSFRIPAGGLVVLVGANGSGKSTIIKLLNRLYDVDAGEILVDGLDIKSYKISDLRRAQAVLTQGHQMYSMLTLAENIGLGNTEHVDDTEMIMQAAEDGGAAGVIHKLVDGVQTVLHPDTVVYSGQLDQHKHRKLRSILEQLERRPAALSGGEQQRIVASRTFMRFRSGCIKFAVADEPTSALDPKGERQLFQRLREARSGKTMIFVTHRFGLLTKHADLIICMKDGQAVELGTHKDLMRLGGEYCELYNVQAEAFAADAST